VCTRNNSGSFALLLPLYVENVLSLIISKTVRKMKNFFKHTLYIPLRSTNICCTRKYSASYARDSHRNECHLKCQLHESHLGQSLNWRRIFVNCQIANIIYIICTAIFESVHEYGLKEALVLGYKAP
jgi:hypothetical protein